MKKVLKIVGGLFGVLLIGFGVWYWQALRVSGDPLLTSCHAVDLVDGAGNKIVGVEDMAFDPSSGTIFMSAYDRRAVAKEIKAGKVTTEGGIYGVDIKALAAAKTLKVTDLTRAYKLAGNEFRPHGFWIGFSNGELKLVAINRRYRSSPEGVLLGPAFDLFTLQNGQLVHQGQRTVEGTCSPNDLTIIYVMVYTDLTGRCQGGQYATDGVIKINDGSKNSAEIRNLSYPNGIVSTDDFLAFSETTKKTVQIASIYGDSDDNIVDLPIAPDNLTVDTDANLYVAGFPNLLDYFFYMRGWFGVKKSPSAVYRIAPETLKKTLLFKDDGSIISGATVALRVRDDLLLGSAWDDHIALCSGMNGVL